MAEHDLNAILFLLKAFDDNLDLLSKDIQHSEQVVVNMRRDWIAIHSKYESFKEKVERDNKPK